MCLIALAVDAHPRYQLVVAANRDEFFEREARPADFWSEHPDLLAGRDLSAGGTWMGLTRQGRFAALTNVRDPEQAKPNRPTRGHIVRDALLTRDEEAFLENLRSTRERYNGYNLLFGDVRRPRWYGNLLDESKILEPGMHGLSNASLNTPWPKVERTRDALAELLKSEPADPAEAILAFLHDGTQAPRDQLPDTGMGPELELFLSSAFIQSEKYGTRCSTALLVEKSGKVTFLERTYLNDGQVSGTARHEFNLSESMAAGA